MVKWFLWFAGILTVQFLISTTDYVVLDLIGGLIVGLFVGYLIARVVRAEEKLDWLEERFLEQTK